MEERGGVPLLVNRAEHRSSSASPSRPGGHDERLRTGDGSIAKGASSKTVGRCVFVCCIAMTGASRAVIMWSTPLFGLARRDGTQCRAVRYQRPDADAGHSL